MSSPARRAIATALSGLIGNRYAFAVLENGSPVAYWAARIAQDRFVTLLAKEGLAKAG